MSAIAESVQANRLWCSLSGEREKLSEAIRRAQRDADVATLFELKAREHELDRRMTEARASLLASQIQEREAEAAKLRHQQQEQGEQLTGLNSRLAAKRDELEKLEGDFSELNFEREATHNRLVLLTKEIGARRSELRALVEGV
jgi:chromosome segregation ATPase